MASEVNVASSVWFMAQVAGRGAVPIARAGCDRASFALPVRYAAVNKSCGSCSDFVSSGRRCAEFESRRSPPVAACGDRGESPPFATGADHPPPVFAPRRYELDGRVLAEEFASGAGAVGVAGEGEDFGVVDEAADHGCGDDDVGERFAPPAAGFGGSAGHRDGCD